MGMLSGQPFTSMEASCPQPCRVNADPTMVRLAQQSWRLRRGLEVICLDARHAQAALAMQLNKIDRNDAEGLAQIVCTGWYRSIDVKSFKAHRLRAARRLPVSGWHDHAAVQPHPRHPEGLRPGGRDGAESVAVDRPRIAAASSWAETADLDAAVE
jgi:hypothetical protein